MEKTFKQILQENTQKIIDKKNEEKYNATAQILKDVLLGHSLSDDRKYISIPCCEFEEYVVKRVCEENDLMFSLLRSDDYRISWE